MSVCVRCVCVSVSVRCVSVSVRCECVSMCALYDEHSHILTTNFPVGVIDSGTVVPVSEPPLDCICDCTLLNCKRRERDKNDYNSIMIH